jgi:hypothetical protein
MVIGTMMPWVKRVLGVNWQGISLKGPMPYEILIRKPVRQQQAGEGRCNGFSHEYFIEHWPFGADVQKEFLSHVKLLFSIFWKKKN